MALAFQRNELGVNRTGKTVIVPNSPKAKLMYYLDCMATVLQLDQLPRGLTNFNNHNALDGTMTRQLLDFCRLLSPEILEGKCIFQVSDLRDSNNEFVELSAARTTVVATSSVMMSGRNIQVAKIMFYKPIWRQKNYDEPMRELSRSSSCILL